MSEGISLDETLDERRGRLLREGRTNAEGIARECEADLYTGVHTRETVSLALKRACIASYQLGTEVLADIAIPQVANAEISEAETLAACARSQVVAKRIAALPFDTKALAVNAVIRLLVERNTSRTIARWPARFEVPVEEATAMAAVVEAALGLDTAKLVASDLFETLA